jgi:hypothetical protein
MRALIGCSAIFCALPATAQGPSTPDAPPAAAQSTVPRLPFAFSGVLYLNYQYGGVTGRRSENKFDLARAYLNFRASAGERDSIRVTLDVFQQTDASRDDYYSGWTMRVKYGYLQHDFVRARENGVRAFARLGLIQTVMIEKEEQYWNRGLSSVAEELEGYFSSADAGVGAGISLPNELGEVYATIMNGNGYTSRETDRFKDFQARLTLSPWASGSGALSGLEISPWVSRGGRASDFASGAGTVAPVAEARTKNRYGVLLTYRNDGVASGASFSRKVDERESADTTADVTPASTTATGSLATVFAILKPTVLAGAESSPWSIVLRADDFQPDNDIAGTKRRYIVGSMWNLSSRTSMTLDLQSVSFRNGLGGNASRTFFLHLIANF